MQKFVTILQLLSFVFMFYRCLTFFSRPCYDPKTTNSLLCQYVYSSIACEFKYSTKKRFYRDSLDFVSQVHCKKQSQNNISLHFFCVKQSSWLKKLKDKLDLCLLI